MIVLIVEHCLGHGPVLVLRGVGQHGANQQDAHRQEANRYAEQCPLGPRLRLLVSLLNQLLVVVDVIDGKDGFVHRQIADQLDWIVQVCWNIHQG